MTKDRAAGVEGKDVPAALTDYQRRMIERYRVLPDGRGQAPVAMPPANIVHRLSRTKEPVSMAQVVAYLRDHPLSRRNDLGSAGDTQDVQPRS